MKNKLIFSSLFTIATAFTLVGDVGAAMRSKQPENCIQCSGTFLCDDGHRAVTATYLTCDVPLFSQDPWSALGLVGLEGHALCASHGGEVPGGETVDCQRVNPNIATVTEQSHSAETNAS